MAKGNKDIITLMGMSLRRGREYPLMTMKSPQQEATDTEFAQKILNEYHVTELDS